MIVIVATDNKLDQTGMGQDDFNKATILRIVFIMVMMVFFTFPLINVPQEFTRVLIYIILGIIGMLALFVDRALKKKEYIDTIWEEPDRRVGFLKRISIKWYLVAAFAIIIFMFFQVSRTGASIVDAPSFEAVPFASSGIFQGILSGIAGIFENLYFFGFLFPTIATNLARVVKLPFLPVIISIVAIALVFVVYHFFVYGLANIVATQAVFYFGVITASMVYIFRGHILSDALHFGNNAAIPIFKASFISPALIFLGG